LKAMAKLLRISHPNPFFPATGKFHHNRGVRESVKTAGARRLPRAFAAGAARYKSRNQISTTVISGRQLKRKL
jgi:hypothetical protein